MQSSPVLLLHICAGTAGLLSGAVAISFRKGSHGHERAGKVFVLSMVALSLSAVYLALLKHQMGNVLGGTFTFYLVTTAWLTARRRDEEPDTLDWGALLLVLILGAVNLFYGVEAAQSQTGVKYGYSAGLYFFSSALALLAGAGDLRMLLRGGMSGTRRLVRHLWRMCYALFVASGSIFIARPHVFPAFLRTTHILFLLGILPLILMLFWFLRVRFGRRYKKVGLVMGVSEPSLSAR